MSRFLPDRMLVPFAGITSTGAGSSRSMNLGSRTIARTRKQVPNLLRKIFFWTLLYALSGGSSPKSTRLGNFLASPFASASCIDCSSREAPGPAPPTPIKDKFPVVLARRRWSGCWLGPASLSRRRCMGRGTMTKPLRQRLNGSAGSPGSCRRCSLVRSHWEWQRSIVSIPMSPKGTIRPVSFPPFRPGLVRANRRPRPALRQAWRQTRGGETAPQC